MAEATHQEHGHVRRKKNMVNQLKEALVILRLKQVQIRTGLSKSTIYLKASRAEFPAPISLGARAVGWLESDINQWINDCVIRSKNVTRFPRQEVRHAA